MWEERERERRGNSGFIRTLEYRKYSRISGNHLIVSKYETVRYVIMLTSILFDQIDTKPVDVQRREGCCNFVAVR